MRIDARNGVKRVWTVWHVEQCRTVHAVWVDDATAQWAEHKRPTLYDAKGVSVLNVFQARRIFISTVLRLILINPVNERTRADDTKAVGA